MSLEAAYAEAYPNWGMDGAKIYITCRMLRDKTVNPDILWNEFCNLFFREAGKAMRQYYQICEKVWINQKGPGKWDYKFFNNPEQFSMWTIKDLDNACKALTRAAKAAADPLTAARVRSVQNSFRITEILARPYVEYAALSARFPVLDENGLSARLRFFSTPSYAQSSELLLRHFQDSIYKDPYTIFMPRSTAKNEEILFNSVSTYLKAPLAKEEIMTANTMFQRAAAKGINGTEEIIKETDSFLAAHKIPDSGRIASIKLYSTKAIAPPQTERAPVLGSVNEPLWEQGALISSFIAAGAQAKYPTEARILIHNGVLYFRVISFQQKNAKMFSVERNIADGRLWVENSIEFFINTENPENENDYLQFIINPAGAVWDGYRGDPKINFNLSREVIILPDKWILDAAIPLKTAVYDFSAGKTLKLNLVRNVYGADGKELLELSGWMPTFGANKNFLSRGTVILP